MRIALIITELDPGGAERCLARLAVYLHQNGHKVHVFAFGPAPQEPVITDIMNVAGVPWSTAGLHPARGMAQLVRGAKAIGWLKKQLAAFQPEVVQSMLFHANCIASLALPRCCQAFFGGARVSDPSKLRARIERIAAKKMQRVVCVSQSVAAHYREMELVLPEKLVVIPNGIRTEPGAVACEYVASATSETPDLDARCVGEGLSWDQLGLPANARVLLSVGRLFPQKGYVAYFRQMHVLLSRLPEHHVVLMGEGPLRQELQAIIDQNDLGRRVHLVGWQPQAADWMRSAELLVLPSVYEGMPNVLLECMARKKSFVAFDVDGVHELLAGTHNQEYQTAMPGDYDRLVERLVQQATDPALRERCAEENLQHVGKSFSLETMFARYERLYQAVCKPKA